MEVGKIFKRYEIKYILNDYQYYSLKKIMEDYMVEDAFGKTTIYSLYLDTPDFLLARRSLDKPDYKEKLRLRSYGTADKDSQAFIEIKKKFESVVYKRREEMTEEVLSEYIKTGRMPKNSQIMREIDFTLKRYDSIEPRVLITYDREAFFGIDDIDFRMTFDKNVLWRDENLELTKPVGGEPLLENGQTLLEIKVAGAVPLWLVKAMTKLGIQQTSFSKYGSAYKRICENKDNMRGEIRYA